MVQYVVKMKATTLNDESSAKLLSMLQKTPCLVPLRFESFVPGKRPLGEGVVDENVQESELEETPDRCGCGEEENRYAGQA